MILSLYGQISYDYMDREIKCDHFSVYIICMKNAPNKMINHAVNIWSYVEE